MSLVLQVFVWLTCECWGQLRHDDCTIFMKWPTPTQSLVAYIQLLLIATTGIFNNYVLLSSLMFQSKRQSPIFKVCIGCLILTVTPRWDRPQRASFSWHHRLSPSFTITWRTRSNRVIGLDPVSASALCQTEPVTSPRWSPGLVQKNSLRPFCKFCNTYRSSGTEKEPCLGNTETSLRCPTTASPPNPSNPTFLSLEAPRSRPGRALWVKMAVIKADWKLYSSKPSE